MSEITNHFIFSELSPDPDIVFSGAEKDVYKIMIDNKLYAAKIYKEPYFLDGEWININRKELVLAEAAAYSEWKQDPFLKLYTPSLLGLITDENKEPIGVLVEWKNGDVLGVGLGEKKYPAEVFDKFESNLRQAHISHYLDLDTIGDANLGVDEQSESIFWFAECTVEQNATREDYEKTITIAMKELRKNYQNKI